MYTFETSSILTYCVFDIFHSLQFKDQPTRNSMIVEKVKDSSLTIRINLFEDSFFEFLSFITIIKVHANSNLLILNNSWEITNFIDHSHQMNRWRKFDFH